MKTKPIAISLEDLNILNYSIAIPKLKQGLVDDSFAYILERDLNDNGISTRWISLDDMGYISICFSNLIISKQQIDAVVKFANQNLETL